MDRRGERANNISERGLVRVSEESSERIELMCACLIYRVFHKIGNSYFEYKFSMMVVLMVLNIGHSPHHGSLLKVIGPSVLTCFISNFVC